MNKGEVTPEILLSYLGGHDVEVIYGHKGLSVRSITLDYIKELFKRFNLKKSGIKLAESCFIGKGFIVKIKEECRQVAFEINELNDVLNMAKKLSLIYEKNLTNVRSRMLRPNEITFIPKSTLSIYEVLYVLSVLFPSCLHLFYNKKDLYGFTLRFLKYQREKGKPGVVGLIKLYHEVVRYLNIDEENLLIDIKAPLVKRKIPLSVFYKALEEAYWEYVSKNYLKTGKVNMLISLQDIFNDLNNKIRRRGYIDVTLEEAFNYAREIMASESVTEGFPRIYVGLDYYHGEHYPIPIRFYRPKHFSLEEIELKFGINKEVLRGVLR